MTPTEQKAFADQVQVLGNILDNCARTGIDLGQAGAIREGLESFDDPGVILLADCAEALDWLVARAPAGATRLVIGAPARVLEIRAALAGDLNRRPMVVLVARAAARPIAEDLLHTLNSADLVLHATLPGADPQAWTAPDGPLTLAWPSGAGSPRIDLEALAGAGRFGRVLRTATRIRAMIMEAVAVIDSEVQALKSDQLLLAPGGALSSISHKYQLSIIAAQKRLAAFVGGGRLWAERPTGDLARKVETCIRDFGDGDLTEVRLVQADELTFSAAANGRLRALGEQTIAEEYNRMLDSFAEALAREAAQIERQWGVRPAAPSFAAERKKAVAAIGGWLPTTPPTTGYVRPSWFSGMLGARSVGGLITLALSGGAILFKGDLVVRTGIVLVGVVTVAVLIVWPMIQAPRLRRETLRRAADRMTLTAVGQYTDGAARAWSREIQPLIEGAITDFRLSADAAGRLLQTREEERFARQRDGLGELLRRRLKSVQGWQAAAPGVQSRLVGLAEMAGARLEFYRAALRQSVETGQ